MLQHFPATLFLKIYGITNVYYPEFADAGWRHGQSPNTIITPGDREEFRRVFEPVEWFCSRLELTASTATCRKMLEVVKREGATYREYFGLGKELAGRLADEMENRLFLSLSLTECDRLDNPRKGWEEIASRFPTSITDIDEAQRCFALDRYAASVFHSLQVVEVGLIELGKLLNVEDPIPGWKSTTDALGRVLKTKYQDRTPFQQKNGAFFEQIHATTEGLKNAWRNKVSHAHGKLTMMTSEFSPQVAEEVLFATRAFMRRLATDGPLASQGEHS
jgi:hypothetical protein